MWRCADASSVLIDVDACSKKPASVSQTQRKEKRGPCLTTTDDNACCCFVVVVVVAVVDVVVVVVVQMYQTLQGRGEGGLS